MALFLIAQIAGRTVAIESGQVESVVDIGVIVSVPRSERHVRGLAALRSRVVTVIDTRAALGLEPGPQDAIDDVAPFELMPLSTGLVLDKGWRLIGRGLVERDGEPILAIALDSLIPGAGAIAA